MPQELIARRFRTCSQKRIAPAHRYRQPLRVAEQIIDRDEIVALLEETLQEEEEAGEKVLQQTQPLIEEATAELEDEDAEMEEDDESDQAAPKRRASGAGKHPTKRASR